MSSMCLFHTTYMSAPCYVYFIPHSLLHYICSKERIYNELKSHHLYPLGHSDTAPVTNLYFVCTFRSQGGGVQLILVQLLAAVCILVWCSVFSAIVLYLLSSTIGLRLSYHEELLGADMVEHNIGERVYDKVKGKLMSRPKWLSRLESQGIVKQRRNSIREAEHMTEGAINRNGERYIKERKRNRHRCRLPWFKIFSSRFTRKGKSTKRRRSCNSCHTIITRGEHDDFRTIQEVIEPVNASSRPTYSRRGARRVHGSPLKWSEVLGVSQETINDIQHSYRDGDCANATHTKYIVISRDKETQTDELFLLEDPQRPFTNAHGRSGLRSRLQPSLDPHIWDNLYEHMV